MREENKEREREKKGGEQGEGGWGEREKDLSIVG